MKDGINDLLDNGGPKSKNIEFLFKLNDKFPFLKTTLFTIPNPKFKNYGFFSHDYIKDDIFSINLNKYNSYFNFLKKRNFFKNNEIAMHGLNHFQLRKKYWPQNEFEFLNINECSNRIKVSFKLFETRNIIPIGFCPAMFGIGHNSNYSLLESLKLFDFNYVCIGTKNSGINLYEKKVSCLYPTFYDSLLNMPQNISLSKSYDEIIKDIKNIIELNGFVVIKGHFLQSFRLSDGFSKENNDKLIKIINYIQNNYYNDVIFTNYGEVSKWYQKIKN